MSVELDTAIDAAETFSALEEILRDADTNFVVIDEVWQGRQVTSPNHVGFIELADLAKRVSHQFETKGCKEADSTALVAVCDNISNWYDKTTVEMITYATGITDLLELLFVLCEIEEEIETAETPEEVVQVLLDEHIVAPEKADAVLRDLSAYLDIDACDYFDEDDDPSLWFTEKSWGNQFPGVPMPHTYGSYKSYNDKDEVIKSFQIFSREQIEAAKAQLLAQNQLSA